MHIYIYDVGLKAGPMFALSCDLTGPQCFCFFSFFVLKISFSLQKEEGFSNKNKHEEKNDQTIV